MISLRENERGNKYKILGFHGGEYEECRLLECDAKWFLWERKFRSKCSVVILSTLMMVGTGSSEASVFPTAIRRHIPEGGILRGKS
jgi:hypothetical protein